jgi:hypothetical protein
MYSNEKNLNVVSEWRIAIKNVGVYQCYGLGKSAG